jgi:hypothetical protein
MFRKAFGAVATAAIVVTSTATLAGAAPHKAPARSDDEPSGPTTRLNLTPSSPELAKCMPGARVKVEVESTTEEIGFDQFEIKARHLAPNRAYTVFLLEQAASPFGAAEYIGDIFTNERGNAENEFNLIVDEAFASTLVNGERVRVDLNQVGMWFADPADDDFCLGPNSPVTPFDGDNEAGVQAFNSANTQPLPAP